MQMASNIVPATAKENNRSKMVEKKPIGHEITGGHGNIQKQKLVDERGDNTAVFLSRTKCHRRRIRRRRGNTFNQGTKPIILANRSPLPKSEKGRNNTMNICYKSEISCLRVPVLTLHTPRTHIPIAKGTALLGKFGSAMGM